MGDGSRDLILARRRFFIASALASAALTACKDETPAQVCLATGAPPRSAAPPSASASASVAVPQVCLAQPPDPEQGHTGAKPDPPAPQVCLRMPSVCLSAPAPPPRVCLKRAPPSP